MKLKYIIYGIVIFGCQITQHMHARFFDIVAEPYDLITLDGKKIATDFKVIEIPGDAPTYGTIRKYIAQAFNIDPSWKNFTIKFYQPEAGKVGKFFFLKPYLQGLSPKERMQFLNTLPSMIGVKGTPLLLIRKRKPEEFKNLNVRSEAVPEVTTEDRNLGWDFDETTVGESDPVLVEKLKMVSEKYR